MDVCLHSWSFEVTIHRVFTEDAGLFIIQASATGFCSRAYMDRYLLLGSCSSIIAPALFSVSVPDSTLPIPSLESYLRASCPSALLYYMPSMALCNICIYLIHVAHVFTRPDKSIICILRHLEINKCPIFGQDFCFQVP